MDFTLFKDVNNFAAHHDLFEDVMKLFAEDGQYLFAALFIGLFMPFGSWRSTGGRRGVAAGGVRSPLRAHPLCRSAPAPRRYRRRGVSAHRPRPPHGLVGVGAFVSLRDTKAPSRGATVRRSKSRAFRAVPSMPSTERLVFSR